VSGVGHKTKRFLAEDAAARTALRELKRAGIDLKLTRAQKEKAVDVLRTFGLVRWAAGYTTGEKDARLDAAATLAGLALEPKRGQHVVIELTPATEDT